MPVALEGMRLCEGAGSEKSRSREAYRDGGTQVMQAAFGGSIASLYNQQLLLSVAQPNDGCTPLQNAADVNGTVVLIQRGACYVSTKVRLASSPALSAVADICHALPGGSHATKEWRISMQ